MASNISALTKQGVIKPPKFMPDNMHYEAMTGSIAYGCSSDVSDMDIVGFCIPPKEDVFPHLKGEIPGFGRQIQRFEQFQKHHVQHNKREYDFTIYSIVKFFQLCMENNPNMIDVLFVPRRCVLYSSRIGEIVRENRKLFLHKGSYHKFKGYAYSQLHKMTNKETPELVKFEEHHGLGHEFTLSQIAEELRQRGAHPDLEQFSEEILFEYRQQLEAVSKRDLDIRAHTFDCKFAYHLVRLCLECEQILREGDLQLDRKDHREIYKSIRRGEWEKGKIIAFFENAEKNLDSLYESSNLRYSPDIEAIKQLLVDCLEEHFGSLGASALVVPGRADQVLSEIGAMVERYCNAPAESRLVGALRKLGRFAARTVGATQRGRRRAR